MSRSVETYASYLMTVAQVADLLQYRVTSPSERHALHATRQWIRRHSSIREVPRGKTTLYFRSEVLDAIDADARARREQVPA